MQIEKKAIEELKAAKYNPRKDLKPGDAEYEKLKRSIAEFGYVEPIIWNKMTGNVVGGHQRLKVLKDLGYTEVDCVIVELDEQKEKALNVALNKISGEWDETLLTALLKDLDDSGLDLTLTGFDLSEAQELFGSGSLEKVKDDEFDAEEEVNNIDKPITEKGDLWIIDGHRLLCGDCTDEKTVKDLMNGESADIMVTDPPYNVDYGGLVRYRQKRDLKSTRKESDIVNDNLSDEDFYNFLYAFYKTAFGVLKGGAAVYVFHSTKETVNFTKAMTENGFKYAQTLVWKKNHFTLGRQDYQWIHEPILYGWKEQQGAGHYFIDDRTLSTVFEQTGGKDVKKLSKAELQEIVESVLKLQTTVIEEDKPIRSDEHPTMKPITLCARLIFNSSHEGDIVYEPFGGSGSTMMAAAQLNRKCYAIELEPKYCDVIVKRYKETFPSANIKRFRNGTEIKD